jgi:Transglycosylase SLT domain
MANIIDALVVTLGLDPANFTAGQRQVIKDFKAMRDSSATTANELVYRGKQAAEFYTGVKNAAIGMFSVLADNAVVKFTNDVAMNVASTGRMASNLGMAANTLAIFGNMIERNGGQASEAAQSFGTLTQALLQYNYNGALPGNMPMGLSMIGATGEDTATDIYKKFNVWAQGQTGPMANMVGQWLGLTQGAINEARKSVVEFTADYKKSEELVHITERQTKAAQALQNAERGVGQAIFGANEEVLDYSDTVTRWLNELSQWISGNKRLVVTIEGIGAALAALVSLSAFVKLYALIRGIGAVTGAAGAAAGVAGGAGDAALMSGLSKVMKSAGFVSKVSLLARLSSVLGGLGLLFHSEGLNEGEDAEIAKMHAAARASGGRAGNNPLLALVRKLENSGDSAVSPAGAIGRNQVMPATARAYGYDPSQLKNPAYNDMVASAILDDLTRRYHGDIGMILSAYNGGTKAARSFATTGDPGNAETRRYLMHAQQLLSSGGMSSTVNVGVMNVYSRADDAAGIARDIKANLQQRNRNLALATQANSGMN